MSTCMMRPYRGALARLGLQVPDMGKLLKTDAMSAGEVACMPASVTLQKTPGGCNLKYTSSDVIQVSHTSKHSPD